MIVYPIYSSVSDAEEQTVTTRKIYSNNNGYNNSKDMSYFMPFCVVYTIQESH